MSIQDRFGYYSRVTRHSDTGPKFPTLGRAAVQVLIPETASDEPLAARPSGLRHCPSGRQVLDMRLLPLARHGSRRLHWGFTGTWGKSSGPTGAQVRAASSLRSPAQSRGYAGSWQRETSSVEDGARSTARAFPVKVT